MHSSYHSTVPILLHGRFVGKMFVTQSYVLLCKKIIYPDYMKHGGCLSL